MGSLVVVDVRAEVEDLSTVVIGILDEAEDDMAGKGMGVNDTAALRALQRLRRWYRCVVGTADTVAMKMKRKGSRSLGENIMIRTRSSL